MDKRIHASRAAAILDSGNDNELPYAALELRMAMESIAYEKLRLYAPRLPAAVLDKWQPPQAMRALLEFEPRADHDFRMRIARENADGEPSGVWHDLGEHRSFKLSWLRKAYNRVGNLLHVPSPRNAAKASPESISAVRNDLIEILREVERVVASTMDATFATTITFDCAACDKATLFNLDAARAKPQVVCISCGAEHSVQFGEDDIVTLHLVATEFECLQCNAPTRIENRKIEIGYRFKCSTCGTAHVFFEKHWAYGVESNPSTPST